MPDANSLFRTMVEQKLIKQIEERSCVDAVGVDNCKGLKQPLAAKK